MESADRFPCELLARPPADRLAYFVDKVIAHPRLQDVHRSLLNAIQQPTDASLILVFGPTGVGKTTLRRRIEKQLIDAALPDLAREPGRIPVVATEAVAPESGQFNWKDYYTRVLLALDDPFIQRRIDDVARGVRYVGSGRSLVERDAAAPALRRALEQSLRQRRPLALIVDEAQHLQKVASGRRLLDQMDTLKSLAALTGTVHVLIGTYELLRLTNLSAQLSRRSVDIHFGSYHADSAADVRAFKSVLLTFQRHVPLPTEPDLVGRWEFLFERSVGCIGVLKSWLNRAVASALETGERMLTLRQLEQQAASVHKLLSLAREIKEGEEAAAVGGRERGELRALVGLGMRVAGSETPEPSAATTARPAEPDGRRLPNPVAQRRPTRDPVGSGGGEP